MNEKKMIEIVNSQQESEMVELVTFLTSDDNLKHYLVYSKDEIRGENKDQIIYISRVFKGDDNTFKLEEISDNDEWLDVQRLLKKIANAS